MSDSKPVELSTASCRPIVAAATAARPLPLSTDEALDAYRVATSRLLLLDYDGTLVPFADRPHEAVPPITLLGMLEKLAASPAQRVALVSGRPRAELEPWFGTVPGLWLAAEHGAFLRDPVSGRWARPEASLPAPATAGLRFLLDGAVEAAPGSFVEEKEYGLVWHHRLAKDGAAVAAALVARLEERLPGTGLCAVPGHNSVDVRPATIDKGDVVRLLDTLGGADFRLAVGDDRTDEDLFRRLGPAAWTVHVGAGPSLARFRVGGPADVCDLLRHMVHASGN